MSLTTIILAALAIMLVAIIVIVFYLTRIIAEQQEADIMMAKLINTQGSHAERIQAIELADKPLVP